ncbi:MAG: hypothetical protein WD688_01715 [Candidatus Binatia bacterium]
MARKSRGDNYSRLEAARRFQAALRGAFKIGPKKKQPKKKAAPSFRASSANG